MRIWLSSQVGAYSEERGRGDNGRVGLMCGNVETEGDSARHYADFLERARHLPGLLEALDR